MSKFRKLSDSMFASPQIGLDDLERARSEGVTLIVNNRPDGEAPEEPQGAEIESAAKAAGIDYLAIPVTHAGFSLDQVERMNEAISQADGNVLAYCRSGTRSTLLWAMAQAKLGMDPETIAAAAAGAGYDISPVRPTVDMLASQSRD